MKAIAFVMAILAGSVALAAQPPDGPLRQWILFPADISVNAATLDATVTSDAFNVRGWGRMTTACSHTNNAATEIQVRVQHSPDGGTTWMPVHAGNITEGTGEYNDEILDYEAYKTVSASDDLTFTLPINFIRSRIVITDTGGGASDTISCYIILGV